jgi:protein gp37
MGCDGCELWNGQHDTCYAGVLHRRYGGHSIGYARSFEEVTLFAGRMSTAAHWSDLTGELRPEKPWLDCLPRLIFVSDMSDALSSVVSFEYLRDEVIANVTSFAGRRHCWLWLTKRPGRMAEFSSWLACQGCQWPTNIWVGTSVTTQPTTTRIANLMRVGGPTTIRFVSVEPQWEPLCLREWLPYIHWVIQGGESGHHAHDFDVAWVHTLMRECQESHVPYFLKQLGANVTHRGERIRLKHSHGGDWSEWPKDLRVRGMPTLQSVLTIQE